MKLLLFSLFILNQVFPLAHGQVHECPNYRELEKRGPKVAKNDRASPKTDNGRNLKCNFELKHPKKIVSPYRERVDNFVPVKPFGSVCLKCSLCLAVAREMDLLFTELSDYSSQDRQEDTIAATRERVIELCSQGFEIYDLRRFKEHLHQVSDKYQCSTHVRSIMDGKWTEKLREMCTLFADFLDLQYLLNEYYNQRNDMATYLCSNGGIFRDCISLDVETNQIIGNECDP